METLKVKDVCGPCSLALFVKESDEVESAIKRFASNTEVHALFVVDDKKVLKGIVKIRHLLNWVRLKLGLGSGNRDFSVAEAFEVIKLSQSANIGNIISPAVSVKLDDSLEYALNVMAREELVELAVVDGNGKLLGEIKLTSIMTALLDKGKK